MRHSASTEYAARDNCVIIPGQYKQCMVNCDQLFLEDDDL